jgi:hypothetical protein
MACKFKAAIEVLAGIELHKIKSLKPIKSTIRTITNQETKLYSYHFARFVGVTALFCGLNGASTRVGEVEEATHRCPQWLAKESPLSL